MENKVLATVAGEEITEAEFNAFLQRTEPIRSWMRLRSSRT